MTAKIKHLHCAMITKTFTALSFHVPCQLIENTQKCDDDPPALYLHSTLKRVTLNYKMHFILKITLRTISFVWFGLFA